MKRLQRKKDGRFITGLCAGIAEYFDISVAFVRAVAVILQISVWGLIIIYFLASYYVSEECCEQLTLDNQAELEDNTDENASSDDE